MPEVSTWLRQREWTMAGPDSRFTRSIAVWQVGHSRKLIELFNCCDLVTRVRTVALRGATMSRLPIALNGEAGSGRSRALKMIDMVEVATVRKRRLFGRRRKAPMQKSTCPF